MFKKFSKSEWEELTGMEVTMISLKDEDVVAVYGKMSEDGGCFVGCKYKDGTYSVVGAGIDRFVSYADMFRIVMGG